MVDEISESGLQDAADAQHVDEQKRKRGRGRPSKPRNAAPTKSDRMREEQEAIAREMLEIFHEKITSMMAEPASPPNDSPDSEDEVTFNGAAEAAMVSRGVGTPGRLSDPINCVYEVRVCDLIKKSAVPCFTETATRSGGHFARVDDAMADNDLLNTIYEDNVHTSQTAFIICAMPSPVFLLEAGSIVARQFKVVELLASGNFGQVYEAIELQTNKRFAVKVEDASERNREQLLLFESFIYEQLQGGVGIPSLRWCGPMEKSEVNAIVIDLLGPNLNEMLHLCANRLSCETIATLAVQSFSTLSMIDLVEFVHSKGFLICDLKPDHFLLGLGDKSDKLFLIDFGLAMTFLDEQGQHVRKRGRQPFVGTPRYASLNVHDHQLPSRRDDMESLGYILVYLCNGSLPWMAIKARNDTQRQRLIGEKKLSEFENLCNFRDYLSYCRSQLEFADAPNYASLRDLFYGLAICERRKRLGKASANDTPESFRVLLFEDLKKALRMPLYIEDALHPRHAQALTWFREGSTAAELDALLETMQTEAVTKSKEVVSAAGCGGFAKPIQIWSDPERWP